MRNLTTYAIPAIYAISYFSTPLILTSLPLLDRKFLSRVKASLSTGETSYAALTPSTCLYWAHKRSIEQRFMFGKFRIHERISPQINEVEVIPTISFVYSVRAIRRCVAIGRREQSKHLWNCLSIDTKFYFSLRTHECYERIGEISPVKMNPNTT